MFSYSAPSLLNFSGTTSTQADTVTQSCSEECGEAQNLQQPEEDDDQADSGACDGEVVPSQVRCDRKNKTITIHNMYCKSSSSIVNSTNRKL